MNVLQRKSYRENDYKSDNLCNVKISDYDGNISKINVPSDAKGKTIHIICEVTDDGSPCLKGYKRIILKVGK